MRFRLTYSGEVKSSGNKPKPYNKHELRLAFHRQLSVLWETNPTLKEFSESEFPTLERAIEPDYVATLNEGLTTPVPEKYKYSDLLVREHEMHGVKWHPCIPGDGEVLSRFPTHNDFLYTVLSDDSLISKVAVDTDELLDLPSNQNSNSTKLVIEVNTRQRNEPYIHL